MSELIYQEVHSTDREDAEKEFASDDPARIIDALLSLTYHDPDCEWVQEKCLHFINHPDLGVRRLTVICFGHLARIHRDLDLEKVLPVLEPLRTEPEIGGYVEEALGDMDIFMRKEYRKTRKAFKYKPPPRVKPI